MFLSMKNYPFLSILLLLVSSVLISCKHEKDSANDDTLLYNSTKTADFTFYQEGAILSPAGGSPHGDFRLRFNSVAASVLDSASGELPLGGVFPSGSVIVKEALLNGNVSLLAVMKKEPSNDFAGSGWLWAEYSPSGAVIFSVGKKGDGCIGCHSSSVNRDLVATFDAH